MDWRIFTIIPVPMLMWLWFQLVRNEAIPVPLPRNTIREMLKLANAKKDDVVYDLGSGDGRVVIIAAKEFGAKSVGIERNRLLFWLSHWLVNREKSRNRMRIIKNDLFKEDIRDATIVVIYLSHKLTQQLKMKFRKELKKGTRIVSASHQIDGWKIIRRIKTGHFYSYLYVVH